MSNRWYQQQVSEDWARARRKAFLESIVDLITDRPRELVPLNEVQSRLNVRGSAYRGLQQVPLNKIIGSEGRYADFDRRFLPRRTKTQDRWKSVDMAHYVEVPLPPVELYKVGEVYFVRDGNHRVSVARERGQADIDAYVTELEVAVPLDERLSVRDLLIKEEYSDFLEWTQLHRLRPQQRIELSALGGYLELIQHINTHRYHMSQERGTEVSIDEAVASWYDNVYMPVVELIRQHNMLAQFPGRTEADLYVWIMKHHDALRQMLGYDPGIENATLDYATQFGKRSLRDTVETAAESLAGSARVALAPASQTPSLELLDFVDWAKVDNLCEGVTIRLSKNDSYNRLRDHILSHRYYLGLERGSEVSLEEAIQDWCTNWYRPVVQAIRQHGTLAYFPDQTESDLYLWIMDHLHYRKQAGEQLDVSSATAEVTKQAASNGKAGNALAQIAERVRRLLKLKR
jgi:hypothetical protein